jgi:hypothetical protein
LSIQLCGFSSYLLNRGTRFQVGHHKHETRLTLTVVTGKVRERHPCFDFAIKWLFEVGCHNTDHTVGFAVENQFLTFKIPISIQAFAPRLFINHDLFRSARGIFTGNECAAD